MMNDLSSSQCFVATLEYCVVITAHVFSFIYIILLAFSKTSKINSLNSVYKVADTVTSNVCFVLKN